jgi:Asparagine synthase
VSLPERLRLTPLELASGYLFGFDTGAGSLEPPRGSAREALERAVLRALRRPPCFVCFSGGVDSSLVLALAVSVARREGLPEPVPFTNRFPGDHETDESEWQERVVAELAVEHWERVELSDELDGVGPLAQRVLRRHGVLWPANAHFIVPALERARGGSMLTGVGGDQILEPSPRLHPHAALLARRSRPRPKDVLRLAYAAAPRPLRAQIVRRRNPEPIACPWLTPHARLQVAAQWLEDAAGEPIRTPAHARWSWRLRGFQIGLASLDALADGEDVLLVHPLADRDAVAALAPALRGRAGLSRLAAIASIARDIVPSALFERRTKAVFEAPFWNRHSDALASDVRDSELDATLVDIPAARAFWREPGTLSRFRSLTLLQSIWLAREASPEALDQRVDAGGDGPPAPRAHEHERR